MSEQLNLFGNASENSNKDEDTEIKAAKKRVIQLRKKINYYADLYYNEDTPEISDYEYDMLLNELKDLEKKFPSLITKSSPTQVVGGEASNKFAEATHAVPMQSLNDVFSYEEVESFVRDITSEYGEDTEFVVETKIDGLSVSLEYENGKLVKGSTRGNGIVGEEITDNLLALEEIKERLVEPVTIEVRGEVYLSKAGLESINSRLEKENKPILANSRNAAAGTLRQLNSEVVAERGLNIFVFNVQKSEKQFQSHSESLRFCKEVGIKTIEYSKVAVGYREVLEYIKEIGELRETLPYDIDGAVVKVNDLSLRSTLGTTTKVPRWAVAYKYPPEEKETIIKEIKVQVGRTGQITPLAIVEPVKIAGSVISKCTLHNFDYVKEKDIRENDVVKIRKAGDVIPEVVNVVLSKRKLESIPYEVPKICPVCGEELEKSDTEVAIRCTNSECEAQTYRAIIHFASRDCMKIEGMGEAVVEQLIDSNIIKDISDIYYIKYNDIKEMDRFGRKSAINLINSIEKSKSNPLSMLIFGLGIRHVGKKAAKTLAQSIDNIYDLEKISKEELENISEVGPKMASSIVDFFDKEKTKYIIRRLEKRGVNIKGDKKQTLSNKLKDITIVVTGSFDNMSREEISELIELNGGKVASSVSKNTSYVIAGENAGSKLTKAIDLKVPVLSFEELINKFELK